MKHLRDKTIVGARWSVFSTIIRQTVQFTISVVLARLLTPQDFGLVGMILIFTGFAQLFSDFGLGQALIHKSDIDNLLLNSVFWINVAAGLSLTLLFAACSPVFALFYHQPKIESLTKAISIIFLFSSFNVVQNAILQKKMDFKNLAKVDLIAAICSGILAVSLALLGYGVWSLIWQSIAFSVISVVIMWFISDWKPAPAFSLKKLKTLVGFGSNLMGFNAFNYFVRNADNFLIGKYLGTTQLGIYSRAYSLMLLPINQISITVSRVAFPAMASIQNDLPRLRKLFLGANRMVGLFAFPIMAGLFVISDHFINIVYGEKWLTVTPVLRILCVAGILQPVSAMVGCIYTAVGRTDIMMKWGIFSGIIYIVSFVIGLHWGIVGVAIAFTITVNIILLYPAWQIPTRLIESSFQEMIRNIAPPLICSIVMALYVWGLGVLIHGKISHIMILICEVATGAGLYWILLEIFRVTALKEFKVLLMEFLQKNSKN